MVDALFKFCQGVMEVVAVLSGYSYPTVNTLAFVYLQPALLICTAALPMLLMIFKLWKQRTPKRFSITAAMVVWFLPFAFGGLKIWDRYKGEFDAAFDKLLADLGYLSDITALGFEWLCILLFIVAFLFLFLLNVFFFTLLRNTVLDAPRVKRRKKAKK